MTKEENCKVKKKKSMSEQTKKEVGLWLVFAGMAVLGFCFYYIFLKLGGGVRVPPMFGVVEAGAVCVFHAALFFLTRRRIGNGVALSPKVTGLALVGGILIMCNIYSSFFMFRSGGELSITIPVLGVSTIFLTVLFGIIALKEKLNTKQKAGLVLALAAIVLLNV